MTDLEKNLQEVAARIAAAAHDSGRGPKDVTLVAATKTQSYETIRAAIAAGVTCCGENRVQELTGHLEEAAYSGAELHFIGHLQTNKVKFVVGKVQLIESVDSLRLLQSVETCAAALGIRQDVLLEVNIGGEESKGGCPPDQLSELAACALAFPHIRLRGLMCIPPVVVPGGDNQRYFRSMGQLYVDIRTKMGDNNPEINCLSMGMSGDYEDAIRFGATHVRVGTALFGARATR
ncbi:MAG: YggS family pyridoxal phosphate-dependent enzyme [Pseudoflavonifractor sp.]